MVFINDYPTIFDNFVKNGEAFAGRENQPLLPELTNNGWYGIIFLHGPIWRTHRQFGIRVLRDLGMGKDVMQQKVLNETMYLIQDIHDEIKANKDNEVNIHDHVDRAIGSVINAVILGYRFEKVRILSINPNKLFRVVVRIRILKVH